MKSIFLTLDLEEWFELDYLKCYDLKGSGVEVVPAIGGFLDLLDRHGIKATVFVLAGLIERNAEVIREIKDRGHEIACHGFDHGLLCDKSDDQFRQEVGQAKSALESLTGGRVAGYRASCFTMERGKLEILRELGFDYDSSKIHFEQHPLYRNLDLTGFVAVDDLVHRQGDFFEYEIPTVQIGGYSIPISGGGYLRMFPLWLIKRLLRKLERVKRNFIIYVHPFELTDMPLPLPTELGRVTKWRATVGRRGNLRKLDRLISHLKAGGGEFLTIGDDVRRRRTAAG